MKATIAAAIAAIMSGCAAPATLTKPTRSGHAEGTFIDTTLEDVQSKLIQKCVINGHIVVESTPTNTICQAEIPAK